MNTKKRSMSRWLPAVVAGAIGATALMQAPEAVAQEEIYLPLTVYRTGAYAPNGIPIANGWSDYLKLLNARDGGINGVKLNFEECETKYDTKLGVECYEKMKNNGPKGAAVFNPLSTGITYQIIPKARVDKIPIHSMGYGQTAAADGRVFEWTFNFPTTYWSQASAFVKHIAEVEGGMDKLKGLKIGLLYHNSPYGKEPIPTLEQLADMHGYALTTYPVDHPGQEQGASWLQIRRDRLDWLIMWGWGVMNQVAIKEATNIRFPMDHFIGVWWAGSEPDVTPSGQAAKGYKAGNFHGIGTDYKLHDDILEHVYNGDRAAADANGFGSVLYNRGLVNMLYDTEAMRTAMGKYGNVSLSGEQVRWGMENLDLNEDRIKDLGAEGLVRPIKLSCEDHEGNGPVFIQQWDGTKWVQASDWIEPITDVVRPAIEEAAEAYAKENNIEIRDCSKEE